MGHDIISQLRDALTSQGMLAGSAVTELLNEYDKIRYILEGLLTEYERGNEHKVKDALDKLRFLL